MKSQYSEVKYNRWARFILGGGLNTALTYVIYLVLNKVFVYQLAYFIAYTLGIIFAYWFNSVVVFRVQTSWKGFFSYPAVYLIQYFTSAFLLGGLVEVVGVFELVAPLLVAILMVPVTYIMNKILLERSSDKEKQTI